ncbi:hypothetical protein J8M51_17805 [Streptomyces scabiei]|nr:hypothetical protein [Streptomyces griseiscabiei]
MPGPTVPGTGSSTILPAVEQRIGSKTQPLAAAAVDPSHIPGLTAPVSVKKEEPEDTESTEPTAETDAEAEAEAEATADAKPEAESDAEAKADGEAEDKTDAETDGEAETDTETEADAEADPESDAEAKDGPEAEPSTDGPVFEASDRRAKITADGDGVRLRLDDQECEFTWDEIGAIETESPRFGKRFTITVHTPDRRWYFLEIEAKAKSDHAAWEKQIDEVLDAYFEDGSDKEEPEDTTP